MTDSEDPNVPLLGTPRKNKFEKTFVALLLFSLCFTSNVIISLLYPFAPGHISRQGYGPVFIGMLFSVYSWAILLFSPVGAVLVRWFGRDAMLSSGISMLAVFSATFGYARQLSFGSTSVMAAVYTASRVLSGCGASIVNLAVFSMAADTFPNDLGKIMGANEVVIGLGFTIGPLIGSLLYVNFGFGPAFLITGAAVFLALPVAIAKRVACGGGEKTLAEESAGLATGDAASGVNGFLRVVNLRVVLAGTLCFCGTLVFGVMEPSLAQHLEEKTGLGQTAIGLVFAMFSAVYSIFGVPMGWIADNRGHFLLSTIGVLVSGLCLFLFGLPIYGAVGDALGMSSEKVILGKDLALLVLLGVGQATLLVPTLPAIKEGSPHRDPAATEAVVAIFNCFQQLGLAVGPLVGAAMVKALSYETALLLTGAALLLFGVVCILDMALDRNVGCPDEEAPAAVPTEEDGTEECSETSCAVAGSDRADSRRCSLSLSPRP